MATILLIDKDCGLSTILRDTVFGDSHTLMFAANIDETVRQVKRMSADLVIVGGLATTADTVDVCRRLRGMTSLAKTPILFLINNLTAQEVARTLDAGGDDCVGKPIVPRELAARVRALLRRRNQMAQRAELVHDQNRKQFVLNNRPLDLTPTEYLLLETLCRHPGQHMTTGELLQKVWDYPPGIGDPALVRNHVRNLRRKLEIEPDHPRIVMSMHGRGYTLNVDIWRR